MPRPPASKFRPTPKEASIGAAIAFDGRPAINFCCSEERLSGVVVSTWPFVGEGLASRSPGFDAPELGLLVPGVLAERSVSAFSSAWTQSVSASLGQKL